MLIRSKVAITLASSALIVLGGGSTIMLAGCSSSPTVVAHSSQNTPIQGAQSVKVEGIAATGDGFEITEQEVFDYIDEYRTYTNNTEDVKWATYLDEMGIKASDVREDAIKSLATKKIIEMKADALGLSVGDAEIDAEIENSKLAANVGDDESSWKELLDTAGYTEESYRDDVRFMILTNMVVARETEYKEPSESEVMRYVNASPQDYVGKTSVAVVYPSSEYNSAVDFASGIASDITEEQFRQQASAAVDEGRATKVVDYNWSCIIKTSNAYDMAIEPLKPGEVAWFQDDDGTIKVVMCTNEFFCPYNGILVAKDMPEDIMKKAKTDTAYAMRITSEAEYKEGVLNSHHLTINDMPDGLPYDVDMELSLYGTEMTAAEQQAQQDKLLEEQMQELENSGSKESE